MYMMIVALLMGYAGYFVDAGPAAYYDPSYDWGGWNNIYWIHANEGRVVGPPTSDNRWCVHPNYDVVGKQLLLVSGGVEIVCTTGDMVKAEHKGQWRGKWGIEVSWSLWNELGDPSYVEVYEWHGPQEAAPEAESEEPRELHFDETGYTVSGEFLEFWEEHGGVEIFGYPVSEVEECDVGECQWFERARFELQDDGQIYLGRIGVEMKESTEMRVSRENTP